MNVADLTVGGTHLEKRGWIDWTSLSTETRHHELPYLDLQP